MSTQKKANGQKNLSGKSLGGQSRSSENKKNGTTDVREAQQLYKSLRRRKVPTALAALICAVAVIAGVWGGTKSGQQGELQPSQQTQQNQQMQKTQDQPSQQDAQEISYTFRTQEQLRDHFERHGIEMGYEDEEAYVAGANRVIAAPDALHKLEAEDGDDVYYLEETNEFVIVSQKGYIRTYFEPDDGLAYYERQ